MVSVIPLPHDDQVVSTVIQVWGYLILFLMLQLLMYLIYNNASQKKD
jgi:hypothetical protein